MATRTKTYKIRKFQNGKNKEGKPFINYSLTLPTPIAEKLNQDQEFSCELTDDGILFRPVNPEDVEIELPAWAKGNGKAPAGAAKPAASRSRSRPGASKPAAKKAASRSRPRPSRAKAAAEAPTEAPQEQPVEA